MENVADPAHVPVSHHGIMGNRYRDANYFDMTPERRGVNTRRFFLSHEHPAIPSMLKKAAHNFQPPCHTRLECHL